MKRNYHIKEMPASAPVDVNIRIKRFDPSKMLPNRISLFVGRRGSGKSICMEDIFWHCRKIPSGICFSSTEDSNPFWGKHIPSSFIYNDYHPDVLKRLVSRQRKAKRRGQDPGQVFVVAEDVLYSNELQHDRTVKQVFQNGRHYGITMLLSMQFALDMPPAIRTNTDYVFCFRHAVLSDQERLYRNYFSILGSFEVFQRVLAHCTNDYECLVLDNTTTSNNPEDCVFYYKAKQRGDFKAGSEQFWAWHYLHFDPTMDEDDEEEEQPRHVVRRPRSVRVRKLEEDPGARNMWPALPRPPQGLI